MGMHKALIEFSFCAVASRFAKALNLVKTINADNDAFVGVPAMAAVAA